MNSKDDPILSAKTKETIPEIISTGGLIHSAEQNADRIAKLGNVDHGSGVNPTASLPVIAFQPADSQSGLWNRPFLAYDCNVRNMQRKGLNLLSLDAGGPRALSQLTILEYILKKYQREDINGNTHTLPRPYEAFDVVCGSGTGGLIGILLIRLKMTISDARDVLVRILQGAFLNSRASPEERVKTIREIMEETLDILQVPIDSPLYDEDESDTPKLIIPVVGAVQFGSSILLRNYLSKSTTPMDITVVDAALATCCSPPMFIPTPVKYSNDFITLISADRKCCNPIHELLAEAMETAGEKQSISCIISLGAGHTGAAAIPNSGRSEDWNVYLEKIALDGETTARQMMVQMGHLDLYHRFSVPHGLEGTITRLPSSASTENYMEQPSLHSYIQRCVKQLRTRKGVSTLEQLNKQGGGEVFAPGLPPLTSEFVMRNEPWRALNKMIEGRADYHTHQKTVVVSGLGGAGKTTLVLKFATDNSERFASIFFVDSTSEESIEDNLTTYVRSLGSEHAQRSFDEAMRFLAQPPSHGVRLIIFDNLDDERIDITRFVPRCDRGLVIITTRSHSIGVINPNAHLILDSMSQDEAAEMLARGAGHAWPTLPIDLVALNAISNEVGCHPIALKQAAAYMKETKSKPERYLSLIKNNKKRMLARPARHQRDMRYLSAYAAFDASYDTLPENSQKFLHLLSFFHRVDFPLHLVVHASAEGFAYEFYQGLKRTTEIQPAIDLLNSLFVFDGECDMIHLQTHLVALMNHSFINVVDTPYTPLISMHSLTQLWAQDRLDDVQHEFYQSCAIRLLACAPGRAGWIHRYLLPHVMHFAKCWSNLHTNDKDSFATTLYHAGSDKSYRLLEELAEEMKNYLGVDHGDTHAIRGWWAACLQDTGRLAEAEILKKELLEQQKRLRGENHPETLLAAANLGVTYHSLGRFEEAEIIQVQVLQELSLSVGWDHLSTVQEACNLAVTYDSLGRSNESEALQTQALEYLKGSLGENDPITVTVAANLADTYRTLGWLQAAMKLEKQVLKQRREIFGDGHPDTIHAMANLAVTYHAIGRFKDAETLGVRALEWRRLNLGEKHPDTIISADNVAITRHSMTRDSRRQRQKRKHSVERPRSAKTKRQSDKRTDEKGATDSISFNNLSTSRAQFATEKNPIRRRSAQPYMSGSRRSRRIDPSKAPNYYELSEPEG